MDSAARNFAALVVASLALIGYGICATVTFVLLPIGGEGLDRVGVAGLLSLAALGAISGVSLARAICSLRRHRLAHRRLIRRVERSELTPPPGLRAAMGETGLDGRVVLVESTAPFSFVYGLLAPRVAISTGMLRRLSPEELRAVLMHERYHVATLDPLRELVGRTLGGFLFLLPAVGLLHRRYARARELAADRRTTAAFGPGPLAGALLAVLGEPRPDLPTGVPLADPDLLSSRLALLETGCPPPPQRLERAVLVRSGLGLVGLTALFLIAVAGVEGGTGIARLLAAELSPMHLLDGVLLCLAPLLCLSGVSYWRIARSARRTLGPA